MTSIRHLLYGIAALVALAWAGLLVAEWTDRGDATCTALYRVDQADYWFRGDCADIMGPRLALVSALFVGAVVLAVLALRTSGRVASRDMRRTGR